MHKRIVIPMLVLLGALAALILFRSLFNDEPQYRGKKLSVWFKQYYRTGGWSSQRDEGPHERAARAFRVMGTNAIPFLLTECFRTNRESAIQTNVLKLLAGLPKPFSFPPFVSALEIREEAASAIGEIKPPTNLLLPRVTNWLNAPDKYDRYMATWLLGWAGEGGEAGVPFLREKLRSPDQWERTLATIGLDRLGPAAESAVPDLIEFIRTNRFPAPINRYACRALARIGPAASNAIPVLKERLAIETNSPFHMNLAVTLICIDSLQSEALGLLQAGLADKQNTNSRSDVISALRDIGTNARPALPLLLTTLKDKDPAVWDQALYVLLSLGETNLAISGALEKLKQDDRATRYNATKFLLRVQPTNALAISNLVIEANELNWGSSVIDEAARLGALAQPVMPRLREIAASKTNPFRDAARKALAEIEAAVAEERISPR